MNRLGTTRIAFAFSACLLAAAAAEARPASWRMTCGQARGMVEHYGSVVMNFSPTVYERVVSAQNFCLHGESMRPEFAPTRDMAQCMVGYSCRDDGIRRRR